MRYLAGLDAIFILSYFSFRFFAGKSLLPAQLWLLILIGGLLLINLIDSCMVIYLYKESRIKRYKIALNGSFVKYLAERILLVVAVPALVIALIAFTATTDVNSILYIIGGYAVVVIISQIYLGYLMGGYVLADGSRLYIYPSGPSYRLKNRLRIVELDENTIGVKEMPKKRSEESRKPGVILSGVEKDRFIAEQAMFIAKAE